MVVFADKDTTGLGHEYAEHENGAWPYWQPAELDGYPAIAYANEGSEASRAFLLSAERLVALLVAADDKDGTPHCTAAKDVAEAVLETVVAGI